MQVIETKSPNFVVNKAFIITTETGTKLIFDEGEGIRIVNRDNIPHIEMMTGEVPTSMGLKNESDFKSVIEKIAHLDEFVTKDVDMLEAAIDENLPTDEFIKAYRESSGSEKIKVPVRTVHLTAEQKITRVIETKTQLKESSHALKLESIQSVEDYTESD